MSMGFNVNVRVLKEEWPRSCPSPSVLVELMSISCETLSFQFKSDCATLSNTVVRACFTWLCSSDDFTTSLSLRHCGQINFGINNSGIIWQINVIIFILVSPVHTHQDSSINSVVLSCLLIHLWSCKSLNGIYYQHTSTKKVNYNTSFFLLSQGKTLFR